MTLKNIKDFYEINAKKLAIKQYLEDKLASAGFGGCEIHFDIAATRIVVWVANVNKALGTMGKKRMKLEEEIGKKFGIQNPRIDVREMENPFLNALFVVRRIGRAIERGIHYKKAVNYYLEKVMDAGATGVLIEISGKIMGKERSATQKFKEGYVLHSGNYREELVDEAHYRAQIKHGTIGVTVRILKEAPIEFALEKKLEVENATA